jgi:ATP-dependent DNA ligase
MAATLTQERFSGPEWSFERKFDGIRLLGFRTGRTVRLLSRNKLPQHLPGIESAVRALPVRNLILDGEVAWQGDVYHVFDLLWLDDELLTQRSLDERRGLLAQLPIEAPLHRVAELTMPTPWKHACSKGWEGVIAKRRDAPYQHRRSPHWLKMKCEASQEFVVGGFTDPEGSRQGLGTLLVGYYDQGDLVYAGRVGTGFDTKLLLELRARLAPDEICEPPFHRGRGLPRVRAHWVRPTIVVQVAFTEWTVHGKLRHSRLIGIREDKLPSEVVRETS